jgi:curved DNA-binding protein
MAEAAMSARTALDLLGLDVLATPDDVRRAFRAAAMTFHPDRPGGSAVRFREIVAAYRRLQRPQPDALLRPAQSWMRGQELWLRVPVAPRTLAEGGRITVETPLGTRTVWITRKAARAGLVRLEGMVLKLVADANVEESRATSRLRRFAAAWAA